MKRFIVLDFDEEIVIFSHQSNIIQEELLKAKTWKTPALNEQFIANLVLLRFPCSASVFAEVIFLYNMAGWPV